MSEKLIDVKATEYPSIKIFANENKNRLADDVTYFLNTFHKVSKKNGYTPISKTELIMLPTPRKDGYFNVRYVMKIEYYIKKK